MTNKKETYNGWKNWETWAANLWLNNDEATYNQARSLVKNARSRIEACENLKSLWLDLVESGAIKDQISDWRMDWYEIADAFLEE